MLNLFTEQYEEEFLNTMNILEKNTEKRVGETEDAMLSFSVMHAAAIAGGSIFYAEYALSELKGKTAEPEKEADEPKKSAKKTQTRKS